MTSASKAGASMMLLTMLLMGCSRLHKQPAPQAQAPPLQTGQGELQQQEKDQHQAPPPTSLPQSSAQTAPPPLPPVKERKVKRPKKHKPAESSPPAPATQQTAKTETGQAPVSAIGQLTGGDSATEEQTKRDTISLISATDRGLTGIKRTLSSEEQTTAAQIRTFLTQAKLALDNGDSDGAHTLATKAKLLLDELIKQ